MRGAVRRSREELARPDEQLFEHDFIRRVERLADHDELLRLDHALHEHGVIRAVIAGFEDGGVGVEFVADVVFLGEVSFEKHRGIEAGETKLAGVINALPNVVGRTWEYWSMRLDHAGRLPPRSAPARKRK